jgi:hypothetical protein
MASQVGLKTKRKSPTPDAEEGAMIHSNQAIRLTSADDENEVMHPVAKKRRVVTSDEDEEIMPTTKATSKPSKTASKEKKKLPKKSTKPPKSVSSRASSVPPSEVESTSAQPIEREEEEVSDAASEEVLVTSKTCVLSYVPRVHQTDSPQCRILAQREFLHRLRRDLA